MFLPIISHPKNSRKINVVFVNYTYCTGGQMVEEEKKILKYRSQILRYKSLSSGSLYIHLEFNLYSRAETALKYSYVIFRTSRSHHHRRRGDNDDQQV